MQFSDLYDAPVGWIVGNAAGLAAALVTFVIGWYLSGFASRGVRGLLPRASGIDKNFAPLLAEVAHYGILLFFVVTALSFVGIPSASILAVLGAAGLALALALQGTLANIAAGIMLIWQRPIAIGEYITGDGVAGVVVEIGLFGTRLRSTSGLYIFTPNQKLWSSAITNHSREPNRRVEVTVTVPETINVAKARRILLRIAGGDARVLSEPAPEVHVATFSDSTVSMQLRCWVPTPQYLRTLFTITENAKLALDRELAGSGAGKAQIDVVSDPMAEGKAIDQSPPPPAIGTSA